MSSSSIPLIALITAGSAGLGATVAELFARNGMRVVINYASNAQRAEDLVAKLKSITTLQPQDGRTDYHAIKADLSSRTDVERLVEEAVQAMCPPQATASTTKKKLDVVFSNGGWTQIRNLFDLEDNMVDDDWDRCFTMNVKSHLWLMHAAKPYLEASWDEEARQSGSFITTASLAGVKVSGSSLAYAVTKAAQLHLAKGLAMLAAPKVRVNSVSPGLLLTEWGLKFPPERIQMMTESSKLRRLATVEDVAEQVLTFVKNKSVTGQNMVLDGGWGL
ncbi:Granaticin polyketide synthase putative ketoacyl reductase 2 [Cytospora mali]|uniref:Granaticin polyketide synthase putative ketoacyl reductase 2 n=1 Tax=Cytospora mali TaxID=578113 RepID=A0A194UQZ7_CYTMA|nr:Granaticin polyketide synthase putative ketoacyl reductase 2 [Valsa mali var. pyri (nom. inval.)]